MQHRKRAAIGTAVAAGLAATGLTVATAGGQGSDGPDPALATVVAARADEAVTAHEAAWASTVEDYVREVAIHHYAIAVYAHHANWQAVRAYVEALRAQQAARSSTPSSSGGGGAGLDAIRACESGGDYGAVSSSGRYRGAYQFDQRTWESVGGSGDPASAPPAEQDQRAQMLYSQRGSSPWPNCG